MITITKHLRKFAAICGYAISMFRYWHVSYFEYEQFPKFKFTSIKHLTANLLYGNFFAISKLSKSGFNPFRDFSEHGIVFSESLQNIETFNMAKMRNIYTFSQRRKKIIVNYLKIKDIKKNVYAVGPYIIGAKNFYNDRKRLELKKKYGRILLCFPAHSIYEVKNIFDYNEFVASIDKVSMYFDSVFICLHLLDIGGPIEKLCKQKGYVIVSNGCPYDCRFLSRQKDLMQLADMTMSNSLGTHIGYSVALGTPFYYVPQAITNISASSEKQNEHEKIEKAKKDELSHVVEELFGRFSFEITSEQMDFVNTYWK